MRRRMSEVRKGGKVEKRKSGKAEMAKTKQCRENKEWRARWRGFEFVTWPANAPGHKGADKDTTCNYTQST